jgi:RimJ/RimL family protein N-acetyltransferase
MKLSLHTATLADAELLLSWRNDIGTRTNSINVDEIQLSAHLAWLEGVLKNQNIRLWIADLDSVPVGTIRAHYTGTDSCELSWTLAPEQRGKGLGKQLVLSGIGHVTAHKITAKVKDSNAASEAIVRSLGFSLERTIEGVGHWSLDKGSERARKSL